jgi:outer membrane lipoprotein-sorting protein
MSTRALGAWALAGLLSAAAAGEADAAPALTADQIVEKNVAARGGLEAWRKIETMMWTGHIEVGNPSRPAAPFVLEYKRPNKMRFEITEDHEKSLRLFDGVAGWKASSGMPIVKRYSPGELRSAREAQGIGGLLIDHKARGLEIALEGTGEVDGRQAYRLALTLASGSTRHLWVDAQTFLELKLEREGRLAGHRTGTVSVFYRDWRTIDGLQLPMTIETHVDGSKVAERMRIEEVTLNPSLSDAHFERRGVPRLDKAPLRGRSAAIGDGRSS